MKEHYIFLANGFEEIEALMVVDLLRRAKMPIKTVSMERDRRVTGGHQITVESDLMFAEMDARDAEMLILPGGMPGTTHLMEHEGLAGVLKEHNKEGKMLAAICAAPSVLGMNHILKGKRATCYPGSEDKLLGADYVDANVVEDGNIITSQGLGTALDFAAAIIARYEGEKTAEQIKKSVMYKG